MFLGVQIHPCGSFHGCFPGRGNQRLNTELTSNQVLRSLDPLKPLRVPFTQHFPNLRCHPKRISLKKRTWKQRRHASSFVLHQGFTNLIPTHSERWTTHMNGGHTDSKHPWWIPYRRFMLILPLKQKVTQIFWTNLLCWSSVKQVWHKVFFGGVILLLDYLF